MSEISGIANLQAAIEAYNKAGTKAVPNTPEDAVKFQDLVKVQFNHFAKMSPSEILDHITESRTHTRSRVEDSLSISQSAENLGHLLRKQENITRKSIYGKASLQEVMLASNEAGNAVKTITTLRNKVFEALDKIMNMQI
jgi:flagellar hook-basal body complex protein FliE